MVFNLKLISVTSILLVVTTLISQAASQDEDEPFDLSSLGGGEGEGIPEFKLDEQMAIRVRALIKHFKQDDPLGIPTEMGSFVQDPMKIQNLEKTFSGTKMKFNDLLLYGLTKFRLDHVSMTVSDLKIGVGLSIDELKVEGLYQMSSWFTKSKGNFSLIIVNVTAEAEVSFVVDEEGMLQVKEIEMDVTFGEIKMNFENLGFLASILQGMVNSIGGFLFDSIKPLILEQAEGKVRGELNRQARSVPQQFPNSINPVDALLAFTRVYMREKGLDPFPLPEYKVSAWADFDLTQGFLNGLSSIHRTGPLSIAFEENIVRISIHLGAENLKGSCKWRWQMMRGLLKKEGTLEFTIEYLTVLVKVGQPANLDKPTTIDHIDLEIGNIAVLSDGIGTADYVLEAVFNILPNLLRKQIVDALEEPMKDFIQAEVQKALQIEKMIEDRLP